MRDAPYNGTARGLAFLREADAAVKTGTAEAGGDVNDAWIGGYLPAASPRYAFVAVVHNVSRHGAEEAGPIAEGIMRVILAHPAPPPAHPA